VFIIRKRLFEREGAPPDTRYDEDTDTVVTSTDGGATWVENPGADPRINPAYGKPMPSSTDPRCASASGMVTWIETVVNAGIDGATISGIANVIFGAILVFLPVSWMFALLVIIGEALLAIGSAALSFSFTEGVYDQIRCILYAHVDSEGKIDEAGLVAAQADIDSQIADLTVSTVFDLVHKLSGAVGFSNAGAQYADPDALCLDCLECDNYLGSFGLGAMLPVEGSTYDAVNDWLLGAYFGSANYVSAIVPVVEGTEYTIATNATWANQTSPTGNAQMYWIQGTDFGTLIEIVTIPGMGDGDNTPFWHSTAVPVGYDGLYLTYQSIGASSTVIMKGVSICPA